LFTQPVREAFPNQVVPILYSEFWGDYWCYFLVYERDARTGDWLDGYQQVHGPRPEPPALLITNRLTMGEYLGQVNLVALLPSLLFATGVVLAVPSLAHAVAGGRLDRARMARALLLSAVLASLIGYAWFLVSHPDLDRGDTIKATYLLQILPCLAIL